MQAKFSELESEHAKHRAEAREEAVTLQKNIYALTSAAERAEGEQQLARELEVS